MTHIVRHTLKETYWKYRYDRKADESLKRMVEGFCTVEITRTQSIVKKRNDTAKTTDEMQDLIQRYIRFYIHRMNIIIGYIICRNFIFISQLDAS